MTLDEIYLKTGINISKLSRIERGIFKPRYEEQIMIAEALGVPLSEIFPIDPKQKKCKRTF